MSESIPCSAPPSEFMVLVERYWSPRLGIGTSHRGFVAEFGWLGLGKHPMKDQTPHATKSTKGIRTIIINLATCT